MSSTFRISSHAIRSGAQAAAIMAALLAIAMPPVLAQQSTSAATAAGASTGVPNPLQGFSQNRGQPVHIEAAALEVRDKDKKAIFTGNVKVVQGDTTMRSKSMVVFYEQQRGQGANETQEAKGAQGAQTGAGATKAATPGLGGSSQISKMEAHGGVTVTQKDQTAIGDTGYFDIKSNTVTLVGNVVVTQGQNVVRGERLVVDMTTGVSQVYSGKSTGVVRMLIHQQPKTPDTPSTPSSSPGATQKQSLPRPSSSN